MRKRRQKKVHSDPFEQLVTELVDNVLTRQTDLQSKLLNTALDRLFDMADEASSNDEQSHLFELMNQLRKLKKTIATEYLRQIRRKLAPKRHKPGPEKPVEPVELSLIDREDMDDMVLVKTISDRAAGRYREQLGHLEARLEFLAMKTPRVFDQKALHPVTFVTAFAESIKPHFGSEDRKILFALFDSEVCSRLDSVYDASNHRLIDAGILPQIKLNLSPRQPPQREAGRPGGPSSPSRGDGGLAKGNPTTPQGIRQTQPGPGGAPGYAMTAAPGTSHYGATTASTVPVAGNAAPPGAAGGGPADFQHYTAGMPANQVGQVLSHFLGAAVNQQTLGNYQHGAPSFPAGNQQTFGHQEIIDALSTLQSQLHFARPGEMSFDADKIKQAVLAELASHGLVTKKINRLAEKTIDFIKLIFDAIVDDDEIADCLKTLLLRLQIPVIKASICNPGFFIYDDHPARQLLDRIAEVGVGIETHTDELYAILDKAVSQILSEYEIDSQSFQQALDRLNRDVDKHQAEVRRKEEEAQRQTLRNHARNTVLKALRRVTTGKMLPEIVHPLILKRWPTLMFNHYLQHGKQNDKWVHLIETLHDIIESIQPIQSADDLDYVVSQRDRITAAARHFLGESNKTARDIDVVLENLNRTYDRNIEAARFDREDAEAARPHADRRPEETARTVIEEAERPLPVLPTNISAGNWYEIYMGDDHPPHRCKLSIILLEDSKLVFVNHRGEIIVEKAIDEFSGELDAQRSRLIMGHSAFDHALKTVVTRLRP